MTPQEVGRSSPNLPCSHPQFFLFPYFDSDLASTIIAIIIIIILAKNRRSWEAHSTWLLSQRLGSSWCFQISEGPFQHHGEPGPGAASHEEWEKDVRNQEWWWTYLFCSEFALLWFYSSCTCGIKTHHLHFQPVPAGRGTDTPGFSRLCCKTPQAATSFSTDNQTRLWKIKLNPHLCLWVHHRTGFLLLHSATLPPACI